MTHQSVLHSIGKAVGEMWRLVSIRSCFSSMRKKYCCRGKKVGKQIKLVFGICLMLLFLILSVGVKFLANISNNWIHLQKPIPATALSMRFPKSVASKLLYHADHLKHSKSPASILTLIFNLIEPILEKNILCTIIKL